MNKRIATLAIGVVVIWVIMLSLIGVNGFGIGFCIFFSLVYIALIAGGINGKTKAKRDMYLANKYDEEYGNKKDKK